MSYPPYPSLSMEPDYVIEMEPEDSVIRSPFEAGYVQTRQLHTRIRNKWKIKYSLLTDSDKSALLTFLNSTVAGGAGIFTWFCKLDGNTYDVRFQKPFKVRNVAGETATTYFFETDEFVLEQI